MIFDINQQYLRYRTIIVVGGHVVDSLEHTTYSSIIEDIAVVLMLMIAVKNELGLMAGYIGNDFCTAPCAENTWSTCGQEISARFGYIVVLKRALYA